MTVTRRESTYVLENAFLYIHENFSACPLLQKGLGHLAAPLLLLLFVTRCELPCYKTICYRHFPVLAENTFLKTSYFFLLFLVGLDILTYRKDYD